MNTRIFALLSVLALASGCIVHSNGDNNNYYGANGNVTFNWTFAGKTCQQSPGIATVTVDIPGQVLQPNSFDCLTQNYPGITLTNFDGGTYSYTVTAFDSQGTALFTQSGTFTVDGNVTVTVDLAPAAGPNSYALVSWGFAGATNPQNAPTCGNATAGDIPNVKVTIDGVITYYNCTDGFSGGAVTTDYLAAGNHNISLEAVYPGADPSQDYLYAWTNGILTTAVGAPTSQSFTLQWAVGGTVVNWAFYNGDGSVNYPTCGDAGVDFIRVNFYDRASDTYVYPYPDGDVFPCPQDGSNLSLYNALPPGTFEVQVDAYNDAGSILYQNLTDVPTVTVQAGAFVTPAQGFEVPIALDLQ